MTVTTHNRTGVALIYIETANNYYARYAGSAGSKGVLTNAWSSDRPLTQAEVEELRLTEGATVAVAPETPRAA